MMDNLTRDSLAAQAAGMTYGKYMAQRGTQPVPAKRIEPVTGQGQRTHCAVCGEPIQPGGKRKYCSGECERMYRNERNRERMMRRRRQTDGYIREE